MDIVKRKGCSDNLVVLSLTVFMILILPLKIAGSKGEDTYAKPESVSPSLQLRVDTKNRARAFCNGMKAVVSIGGFFEFYELSLTGSRKRIWSGPWNGRLTENPAGTFIISGNDPASDAVYTLSLKQVDPSTIEISMTYKAPSRLSNISFEFIKISGDLFKGATIEATPASFYDAGSIPPDPLPIAKRILLKDKNRIIVKGALCDLEIKDLMDTGTIRMADFRNIPWDPSKSILFNGDKKFLYPGRTYSFKYSIHTLPPSRSNMLQGSKGPGNKIASVNAWPFYAPPPKEQRRASGQYLLHSGDGIWGMPLEKAETILKQEIGELASVNLSVRISTGNSQGRGIHIQRVLPGKDFNLPAEGFEISVTPDKAVIRAADERGCLYGAYALIGLLKRDSGNWKIPCGTIRDWPDLPIRGVCIEMLKPAIRDIGLMKKYLDAFSRARSNVVIFLHVPRQMLSWSKNVDDGGWTKDQMREIGDYARALHMDVWAGMISAFKATDFKQMEIAEGSTFYDPLRESYKSLFSLYEELLKTYQPKTLLISHDEIKGLSIYSSKSSKSTADILTMDVRRIHDWLKNQRVQTAMWGDMLLDHKRWEAEVGSANSNNPTFNSGSTHEALKKLPSDILILDWHYTERTDYRSIEYFRNNGFRVVGSPWHDPNAAKALAQSVKRFGGQGVIATSWGLFSTLSPAATTLYAPMCAWSAQCAIDKGDGDVTALAETMRYDIKDAGKYKQRPIDLSKNCNRQMVYSSVNMSGFFDIGPVLDLRTLISGKQVFDGIVFDLLPDSGGKNTCIIVACADDRLPKEKEVFQGDMQGEKLVFLHTAFMEDPQLTPRKIGRYSIKYDSGRSESIDLLETGTSQTYVQAKVSG